MSDAPVVLARFTPHRGILAGMFLCLVMFTVAAAGTLLTVEPEDLQHGPPFGRQALWVVLVACPVFAADTLARLIRRTPNLVATEEGLVLRSILGFTPPIPWSRIAAIGPVVIGKKLYLGINLDDPRRTLAGFGTGMRLMHVRSHAENVPNITLRAFHLGANPVEAAEVLERIRVARGAP
ncbi:MAG: hypothetical protein ACE5EU_02985 [Paracoccaceae bacterium]